MPANRYQLSGDVPQPPRIIAPAATDIIETMKAGVRVGHWASKYYQDPTLAWVIMCANPAYYNEFEIPVGTKIRIPFPLERVFAAWLISKDI